MIRKKRDSADDRKLLRQASGETLQMLRKRIGLSQEKLAYKAGVERSHMGALERGTNTPNFETIFKLLPILKVSFAEYATLFESTLRVMRLDGKAQRKDSQKVGIPPEKEVVTDRPEEVIIPVADFPWDG